QSCRHGHGLSSLCGENFSSPFHHTIAPRPCNSLPSAEGPSSGAAGGGRRKLRQPVFLEQSGQLLPHLLDGRRSGAAGPGLGGTAQARHCLFVQLRSRQRRGGKVDGAGGLLSRRSRRRLRWGGAAVAAPAIEGLVAQFIGSFVLLATDMAERHRLLELSS